MTMQTIDCARNLVIVLVGGGLHLSHNDSMNKGRNAWHAMGACHALGYPSMRAGVSAMRVFTAA